MNPSRLFSRNRLVWGAIGLLQFASSPAMLKASAQELVVPIVSLSAARAETREPLCIAAIGEAALPAPSVFVLSRQGSDLAREVSVLILYDGTAINGKDYDGLPEFVTIPAGQDSVEIEVSPRFDELAEGD